MKCRASEWERFIFFPELSTRVAPTSRDDPVCPLCPETLVLDHSKKSMCVCVTTMRIQARTFPEGFEFQVSSNLKFPQETARTLPDPYLYHFVLPRIVSSSSESENKRTSLMVIMMKKKFPGCSWSGIVTCSRTNNGTYIHIYQCVCVCV
jgi:hypothetical protein